MRNLLGVKSSPSYLASRLRMLCGLEIILNFELIHSLSEMNMKDRLLPYSRSGMPKARNDVFSEESGYL